uniref:DUF1758 domain-containing protein n=1 Tax=Heterorhabditis bacteriophora TaxID=37862 RepID=A0A1I7WSX2_HETBA
MIYGAYGLMGTSTNKQTLSVSIPSHTQYDFETVMLQTPPYPHVIQGAISQYVSQELLSKSPSHISSSYYLNNISDDEDYESSVEFSSSGSAEYVSETNHEQTVTSIPPTNSADTSFEKVSGKTDQPHEINTDQSKYLLNNIIGSSNRILILIDTVTSTKQYSEKRKETIVELFDESGRIGPDFKVRDQIIFKSQPSPPVRVVDHASIDTNLLEKDIMVVDIKKCSDCWDSKIRTILAPHKLIIVGMNFIGKHLFLRTKYLFF